MNEKLIFEQICDSLYKFQENNAKFNIDIDKTNFVTECQNLSEEVINDYMAAGTKHLDRHKLASIAIIIASAHIKSTEELKDGQVFLGAYIVALYVALSYMEKDLNAELHNAKMLSHSENVGLCPPDPVICETRWVNSTARLLYWEEQSNMKKTLRVLELANSLFLIEEYTLLMNDIDIEEWTFYKRNKKN